MAFGRVRANKRSSNSSASTITTLVFISVCVLGVWMLSYDNGAPPQSTTRTSTTTNDESEGVTKQDEKVDTDLTSSKDLSLEKNVGGSYDGRNENGEVREKETRVDETAQGVGGKDSIEEGEKQDETQKVVSEEVDKILDKRNNEGENDENSKYQEQSEERKGEQSIKDEKQSDENPQQQQDDQPQTVTFKDETKNNDQATQVQENIKEETNEIKKDQATQQQDNIKEETNTRLDKDDANQQEKSVSQKQDKETIGKQEGDFTSQDTDQNTQSQDSKEETNTRQDHDESIQKDKEAMTEQKSDVTTAGDKAMESNLLPNSGIPKESNESKSSWATQAAESRTEKQRQKGKTQGQDDESQYDYTWKLCNVTAGADYIPCLDNEKVLKQLRTINYVHFEHRERHCPEDHPTCLVPFPQGYKIPIQWPKSREKIWFHNVPHTELAKVKGHQNWVKVSGEFLTFPGGGTQFIHGALHYIDFLEKTAPEIKWGRHTRVVLDVGCGVASFGGYLFERDVLTMSFAPKDEHEAQVQFALERGIPAISAVMGSQRLPFPSGVFDIVHCARCRVPWHTEGGRLLLELNRVLRPGGFFVWSATPVYQKLEQDVEIWEAMFKITSSMCWKLEKKEMDTLNKVGAAVFRKPTNNSCYDQRQENVPPMCKDDDDPNAAWYVPIQACLHRVPTDESTRGSKWPLEWPKRLLTPPYWLNKSQIGVYGRVAPNDFVRDYKHWHYVVNKSYLTGLGIDWPNVRNVMDMRAVYGGFAAALRDLKIWVLNVVNVNAPDTLPIIYDRGLFGIYHDWCESFSTYPRTYDLLHADHLFSKLKERCKLAPVMAEIDRIVRPGGKLIVRDESNVVGEVENMLKSLHWEVQLTVSKDQEGMLSATKTTWRPQLYSDS